MTNQYPWNSNTTPPIASQDDPRYETPGGAQHKVDTHVNVTSNIADRAVTQPKIARGAVGANQIDPALLEHYGDIATNAKFEVIDEQLADTGVSTLGDLHMVFQYNYENDPSRLKRLKAMGINTVILPYHVAAWQRDIARVQAFISRNNEYGLYTILEADTDKLIGSSFQQELDFLSSMDDLPGLIGYYTLDEPVWKNIPIADQILTYTRMKTITSKNIFISEVPLLTGRETRFQTYYTPKSYDMYIINTYYSHLSAEDIVSNIVKSVTNFYRYGLTTPKNIIANFPFFSDSTYPYPATESTTRAHIEGWKAFFSGNYCVFAHDNPAFATAIDNDEDYQKYVGIIATSLKANDVNQLRQFLNGINVVKESNLEKTNILGRLKILLSAVGDGVVLVPEADTNLSTPILYGTDHAQNNVLWAFSRGGTATVKNVVATDTSTTSLYPGGITIGGGIRIKKYLVGSATLDFGTVSTGSFKELTIPVSGALVGDSVVCNAFVQPSRMIDYKAFVSAAGIVTICLKNGTAADIVVGSTTWYVDVTNR
ncbi:hypothetical protein BK125_04765 [Paenibacillus odorifer]|uniref:Uncharacterized protein n=1 Tax=Paenibacillus odorifer TaxID=189426 RepID=A0ABX3GQR9_9BACL|nr:hypothetical protein [Paenibacillus odorifer]OMC79595.1 hypothetical protein BK125_04765 [Paenibacillus odorifer]OMD34941.1 hypothetical protein BSO21_10010 [Paenibacillus odorifer]